MKMIDVDVLVGTLTLLIQDVTGFMNVGKNMTPSQIGQTVYLIIDKYPSFKIDDFLICFNNAKLGVYGKTYDRLDGLVICEWLNAYDSARDTSIEEYRANERKSFDKPKKDEEIKPMPDWVKLKFAEMFKEKPKAKVGTVVEKTWEEHLLDKKVARWDKQFDNLYAKFGENKNGFRFLKVGSNFLSRQEFIKYKYNLK